MGALMHAEDLDENTTRSREWITVQDSRLNYGMPTNIPAIWNGHRMDPETCINLVIANGASYKGYASLKAAHQDIEVQAAPRLRYRRRFA